MNDFFYDPVTGVLYVTGTITSSSNAVMMFGSTPPDEGTQKVIDELERIVKLEDPRS